MRRFANYQIRKESSQSQREGQRFNPAYAMKYRLHGQNYRVILGAGDSDDLDIFREGDRIYVLNTNSKHGYVGLQVFEGDEEVGEAYLQGEEVDDTFKKDLLDYSAPYLIRRLLEGLEEY